MPILELLIDATGMQRGAAQAKAALDSIYGAGSRIEPVMQKVGGSLSSAFQVTGGGVQIATGISQTAKAFGELNTAAGLFNASRTLLEIGNTARDFGQLRGAVGGAATVFGTLGAVIRANPIGAVATAIGIAATAFAAFSGGAKQAVVDYRALAEEVRKNSIFAEADRVLGIPADSSKLLDQRLQQIRTLTQGITSGQGLPGGFGQLRDTAGLTNEQLIASLAFEGNQSAAQFLSRGSFTDSRTTGGLNPGGSPAVQNFENTNPANIRLTNQQALAILHSYTQSYLQQSGQIAGPSFGPSILPSNFSSIEDSLANSLVGRPGYGGQTNFGLGTGLAGLGTPFNAEQQARNEESIARYNAMLEEQTQRLDRAAAAGEQFGQAIGGALFDAISGANTLRGALASVFQSLARQGFEQGVGGIFGAVVKGITGVQAAQNNGTPQVGGPGITSSAP